MNREIKFRAYHHLTKKIINPEEVSSKTLGKNPIEWHNERKWTLMQYTGLKDVNGQDIYEGDVLEFPFEMGIAYVINDGFRFAIKSFGSQTIEYESEEVLKQTKIIGNIYETIYYTQSSE